MDRFVSLQKDGRDLDIGSLAQKVKGSSLFQRVQVIHLVCKVNQKKCLERPLSDMEKMLKNYEGNISKLMAKLYQVLLGVRGGELKAKQKWERDLEEKISWEDWRRMNMEGRRHSRNVAMRE